MHRRGGEGILVGAASDLYSGNKEPRPTASWTPWALVGGVVVCLFLMAALYPVEEVRRANRKLVAQIGDLKLDLEAHQEALKISRQKCEAKITESQENERQYKETIEYYKQAEQRLGEQWCQKITDVAMSEYKKVCKKNMDESAQQLRKVATERDELVKKMETVAMCCKSATAKNKALLSGLDEGTARKKGAQAVAASIRAMDDPTNVKSHNQRVVWRPGQRPDLHGTKSARPKRRGPGRIQGLGDVKDMLAMPEDTAPLLDTVGPGLSASGGQDGDGGQEEASRGKAEDPEENMQEEEKAAVGDALGVGEQNEGQQGDAVLEGEEDDGEEGVGEADEGEGEDVAAGLDTDAGEGFAR